MSPKAQQHRQQFAGVRATRIVRIDLGISNDAVGPNDVTRWHRQRPTVLAIANGQVVAEALVDSDQIVRKAEAQSKLIRNRIAVIAEYGEAERVLLLRLAAVWRGLRRDRDQGSAKRADFFGGGFN